MFEPSTLVLYVENTGLSSQFYENLLGLKPREDSPSFHAFLLSKGIVLGLKETNTVEPPVEEKGMSELAFTVESKERVDALFKEWQAKGIKMILNPSELTYGYGFVALDLDGHRLRVVSLKKS
ncbi:MAG: VOC family protein [Proteobacteria bacterium]|nr:VOC family protein [Pseudomonadota bacterium]